jgi:hypothetical protein
MTDERDELIARVRETLRAAPAATPDPRAVAQVLHAVWESPAPSLWQRLVEGWRGASLTPARATALAGAALLLGFVARGAMTSAEEAAPVMASGSTTQEFPVQSVANSAPADGMVLTQFIFEGKARSVSLVGDFNQWLGGESPLTQLEGGLWTASIPLTPGRHVYAFLVDDTLVVADPRAPKAGDSDYGQEGSVVMVFAR